MKMPSWLKWPGLVCSIALVVLLSSCGDGRGKSANMNVAEFVFDPGPVSELELKGVLPDGTTSWIGQTVPPSPVPDEKLIARGREVFAKACAACHGAEGQGDGPLLSKIEFNSSPANFTIPLRTIKVRSTQQGTLPTDEDLFRTITRGFPNTAMLSFRNLPADDRWALVHRIKLFWAGKKVKPPVVVEIPKKIPSDPELLAFGRKMYDVCKNCHGSEGMGGTAAAFNATTGKMYPGIAFARDGGKHLFVGASDEDIARTLMTGLSQISPMMNFQPMLYGEEPNLKDIEAGNRKLWGTVYYTRQIIEAGGKK